MKRNPLMEDVIRRNIKELETAPPGSPQFQRAKGIVEAYRHEEILSMQEDTLSLTRKLMWLTWALLFFTAVLAFQNLLSFLS